MTITKISLAIAISLLLTIGASAQDRSSVAPPFGSDCGIAGTWYGGSVVAYQMTIIPTVWPDRYTVYSDPMFTDGTKNTLYTGTLVKRGQLYEGSLLQMTSNDPAFATFPPTLGLMPDINAGWVSMKLVGCNTVSSLIPFFGLYLSNSVWTGQKTPMIDAPDVDLLNVLNGGKPIIETYHRLPATVNRALLHHE
jgi:hypothetical protein